MEESTPRGRKPFGHHRAKSRIGVEGESGNAAEMDSLLQCLRLWTGSHEGIEDTWLRWCDERGNVILSGAEASRAANLRNEKLAAKLRETGINSDEI